MGEKYMKVAVIPKETSKGKGKGKGKLSSGGAKTDMAKGGTKVTVMKVQPQVVPLPFRVQNTGGRYKRSEKEKEGWRSERQ